MAENPKAKYKAEILIKSKKSGKVTVHKGRFGLFYEAYALCRSRGYELLFYTAIP